MRSRKEITSASDSCSTGIGTVANMRPVVEVLLDIRDQNEIIIKLLQNQEIRTAPPSGNFTAINRTAC